MIDGLVGSDRPEVLVARAGRLRIVVLVHLPLGLDGPDCDAAAVRVAGTGGAAGGVGGGDPEPLDPALAAPDLRPRRGAGGGRGARGRPAPGSRAAPTAAGCSASGRWSRPRGTTCSSRPSPASPTTGWTLECVGALERDPAFVDRLRRGASGPGGRGPRAVLRPAGRARAGGRLGQDQRRVRVQDAQRAKDHHHRHQQQDARQHVDEQQADDQQAPSSKVVIWRTRTRRRSTARS